MQADIRLIATDLDGTLIGSANEFPLYTEFRNRINALRRARNAAWVVCTGRSRKSFQAFFNPMSQMGLLPDYIIVRHAYIYTLTRFGFMPCLGWNARICILMRSNRRAAAEALRAWHERITGGVVGVRTVVASATRLCLRFKSEEAAADAAALLEKEAARYNNLMVFQYMLEVDVRSVPFTKGMALIELGRHLGITQQHILAIGNGHNDISMLDGTAAQYVGCPSNSEAAVMEAVRDAGGHIASKRSLGGVLDVIDAYRDGDVNSSLPEWFHERARRYNPLSQRAKRHSSSRHRRALSWIVFGMVYAVLTAFAAFDLLPFSGYIMKPFYMAIWVLQKIVSVLPFG
jgi:HAD superfamily hydrolase (TIGR01484 family)